MENFENISSREYFMWEENNVFESLRLMNEGSVDPTDGTTVDQYEGIFADWDRWGDEMDLMGGDW